MLTDYAADTNDAAAADGQTGHDNSPSDMLKMAIKHKSCTESLYIVHVNTHGVIVHDIHSCMECVNDCCFQPRSYTSRLNIEPAQNRSRVLLFLGQLGYSTNNLNVLNVMQNHYSFCRCLIRLGSNFGDVYNIAD